MRWLNVRSIRAFLIVIALILGVIIYWRTRPPTPPIIPPEGLAENDTGGKVPGNPAKAIADMKKFHQAINFYRSRHGGEYPSKAGDIVVDMITHNRDYKVLPSDFSNPDSKYSDSPAARNSPQAYFPFIVPGKRPDGSPIGGPKPPGTRDVLAYCDLYYHRNIRVFKGDRTTSNPVGFYIVLWDDGQVEKVPYDRLMFVPKGGGEHGYAFQGQAGVPTNARTYKDFYANVVGKPAK